MAKTLNYDDAPGCVRDFLNYKLSIQDRSKLTVFNYYHDLRTFARFILKTKNPEKYIEIPFNEIPFSDATNNTFYGIIHKDIEEFLTFVTIELNNSNAAKRRKLSCLKSFYKYQCINQGKLKHNPTEKIESVKKSKTLPKFLSLDESKQLLESVDGNNAIRDFCIITLFLNCGFRVSELSRINISDIAKDFSSITVTGKGSKQRRVFLNDACKDAIIEYLKVRPKNAKFESQKALFISRNKNRLNVKTIQWLIYKHLNDAGLGNLKMSVHKLRHTAATLMYAHGGTDVRVLKDILGHEELSTTQIYTHVKNQQMQMAAENNPLSKGVKRKKNNKYDNISDLMEENGKTDNNQLTEEEPLNNAELDK